MTNNNSLSMDTNTMFHNASLSPYDRMAMQNGGTATGITGEYNFDNGIPLNNWLGKQPLPNNQVPNVGSNSQQTVPTLGSNLEQAQTNYYNEATNSLGAQVKYQDAITKDLGSWQHQYLQPVSQAVGALSSLAGIYLGFKQYGIAKQQLAMAQDQWNTTKNEMNRINNVRQKLTASYIKD